MDKKVALFNSPKPFFKGDGIDIMHSYVPLAVSHLNGFLQKNNIQTKIIDLNILLKENKQLLLSLRQIDGRLTVEEFIEKNQEILEQINDYLISNIDIKDCDILGISILEKQSLKLILPFIREIKRLYPDKKIILGGEFGALEEKAVDHFVYGKGEQSLLKIVDGIRNNKETPKILSEQSLLVSPNDQIVKYDHDLMDSYRYISDNYNDINDLFLAPILPYKLGEGCLYRCSFCDNRTNELNSKDIKKVIADIKSLKKEYKYRYFYFLQEHLTISKAYMEELCDSMIDSKLDILWSHCIKPLGYLNQKIYNKLRESGCIRLSYGIETGSERIIKLMNKGHTVSDCDNNLRYAHKAGIFTESAFFSGFPTETEDDFNQTIEFIKRNSDYMDAVGIGTFRLHNQTDIMRYPERFGIKIKEPDKRTKFVSAGVHEYDEIEGPAFEELQKQHQLRQRRLYKEWLSAKNNLDLSTYVKSIIFPLYDILESKDKVKSFLKENSDILNRKQARFHSLFTGALCNQKKKGNLHVYNNDRYKTINAEELSTRLKDIFNKGFKKLIITGGEPLMQKDIFKTLSEAKEMGFEYIIINTNARMLKYYDFCKKISQYIDEIIVISPSDNKNEYESISGVKGSYAQMIEGINNWKALNKKIRYYSKTKNQEDL